MAVDLVAHVGDDPLAEPRDQEEAAVGCRREGRDNPQQTQEVLIERIRALAGEPIVDDAAQRLADRQHGAGGEDQGGEGAEQHLPVGQHEAQNLAQVGDLPASGPVFAGARVSGRFAHIASRVCRVEPMVGPGTLAVARLSRLAANRTFPYIAPSGGSA